MPFDVPPDEPFDVRPDQDLDESPDLRPDMMDETPDSLLDMTPDFGADEGEDTPPDMGQDPQIRVTPQRVDFGTNPLNSPVSVDVTMENIGAVSLDLIDLGLRATPSQGFSVGPMVAPLTLQPGQLTTVTVTFNPTQASRYANDLEIASTDADEPLISVPLVGRGFSQSGALASSQAPTTWTLAWSLQATPSHVMSSWATAPPPQTSRSPASLCAP